MVNSISIIRLSGGAVAESCWPAIRAICCRTENNGEPIAESYSQNSEIRHSRTFLSGIQMKLELDVR